jgi:hypothetical protein
LEGFKGDGLYGTAGAGFRKVYKWDGIKKKVFGLENELVLDPVF